MLRQVQAAYVCPHITLFPWICMLIHVSHSEFYLNEQLVYCDVQISDRTIS